MGLRNKECEREGFLEAQNYSVSEDHEYFALIEILMLSTVFLPSRLPERHAQ
jgi:hypothetical protein